jgi:hypothetical protein
MTLSVNTGGHRAQISQFILKRKTNDKKEKLYKQNLYISRFHVVFENLIDVGFEVPSGKLTTVHNMWLVLESLAR